MVKKSNMFDSNEEILYLKGDYDAAGLEEFKRQVLAMHGTSQKLPLIVGGAKDEEFNRQLPRFIRPTQTQIEKSPESYTRRLVSWIRSFPR